MCNFQCAGLISESFARSVSQHTTIELSAAQVFTYKQLQVATNNFNEVNMIGRGGFGSVFRGVLPDGRIAAIKQLDQSSKQGDLEFRVEVYKHVCVSAHMCVNMGLTGCCSFARSLILLA